jgi:hypothetical protein
MWYKYATEEYACARDTRYPRKKTEYSYAKTVESVDRWNASMESMRKAAIKKANLSLVEGQRPMADSDTYKDVPVILAVVDGQTTAGFRLVCKLCENIKEKTGNTSINPHKAVQTHGIARWINQHHKRESTHLNAIKRWLGEDPALDDSHRTPDSELTVLEFFNRFITEKIDPFMEANSEIARTIKVDRTVGSLICTMKDHSKTFIFPGKRPLRPGSIIHNIKSHYISVIQKTKPTKKSRPEDRDARKLTDFFASKASSTTSSTTDHA